MGVHARDELSGDEFDIATVSVVNATGVWADDVFTMTEHEPSHRITPAKGVHVSVARDRLPADVAAVFSVPNDRRSVFVVPFLDAPYTYVGTTDTAYDGSLDEPRCTPDDVAYLLRAVNASTSSNLVDDDVTGVWAGLRPLLAPAKGKKLNGAHGRPLASPSRQRHAATASSTSRAASGPRIAKWPRTPWMPSAPTSHLSKEYAPNRFGCSASVTGDPPTKQRRTSTVDLAKTPQTFWP